MRKYTNSLILAPLPAELKEVVVVVEELGAIELDEPFADLPEGLLDLLDGLGQLINVLD